MALNDGRELDESLPQNERCVTGMEIGSSSNLPLIPV